MEKIMKGILIVFFLCLTASMGIQAQTISGVTVLKSSSGHVNTDTISNTTEKIQVGDVGFNKNVVSIQTRITKINGTPGGYAILEASNDGVDFKHINTADTLTIANVAVQSRIWTVSPNLYKYFRVKVLPTGSSTSKMNTIALWRRE